MRTRGEPAVIGHYLQAPIDAPLPALRVKTRAVIRVACQRAGADHFGDSLDNAAFCAGRARLRTVIARRAKTRCQFINQCSCGFSHDNGGDFRRQQAHDDTVFIGEPRRPAVETQERSARALFPAETKLPSNKPSANHLKPTGASTSLRPKSFTTRSIIAEETSVLPTTTSFAHSGRCWNR